LRPRLRFEAPKGGRSGNNGPGEIKHLVDPAPNDQSARGLLAEIRDVPSRQFRSALNNGITPQNRDQGEFFDGIQDLSAVGSAITSQLHDGAAVGARRATIIGLAQIVYEFTHGPVSRLCYPSIRSKERRNNRRIRSNE
jgi:hypothetical protein